MCRHGDRPRNEAHDAASGPDRPRRLARREKRAAPAPRPPKHERTSPTQFLHEVRGELRKVAWPTKSEVINYSIIVLIAVVLLTALIAGLDWFFGSVILRLYNTA